MILYFNPAYLKHSTIQQAIIQSRGHDTFSRLANLRKINKNHTAWYSRKGTNLLPFKSELIDIPGFAMPDYDPDYTQSWTQITDQRCHDLHTSHWHRPWLVMWSGGIDSTVIVASLLKNLDPADLDNITIACNPVCIWENPQFYFDHIMPNFKVVNSTEMMSEDFEHRDAYVIDGEPADQLFGCAGGYLDTLYQNPDLLYTNIINNKDCAIDAIAGLTDRPFAEWYYHVLVANAASAGVSVTTLHDLIGWSGFNNAWISVKFRVISDLRGNWRTIKNAKSYIDKFVHWYDSNEYQQWAMNPRNASEKIGSTTSEYKLAAKKYIHSVDNNGYYFKFKTKMASADLYSNQLLPPWCCIDQDWNFLNLQEHEDQIISMLPNHLV
ncbi:hypothetical protein [Haliscomenobacter sp.]|uniref:hypothetical protein n=1 Tax=Haliscomenobacter sp. TaxID=2717303 RepID=UPI003364FD7E